MIFHLLHKEKYYQEARLKYPGILNSPENMFIMYPAFPNCKPVFFSSASLLYGEILYDWTT